MTTGSALAALALCMTLHMTDYIGRRISPQIVLNRYQRRTVANCPTTERDVISDPFQIHAGYGVDGQLIKDRSVNCNSQNMEVTFEFAQPFNGIVYASNYYGSEKCRWEGDGSRRLVVPVPLKTNPGGSGPYCGVKVQENTGEFTAMLVVTPMKGLLVDGMTGLNVRCLYNIGDVTLTLPAGPNGAGILISPQTQSGIVTGSGGSPFLQMAIRDGHGINGEIVSSATVGQRITLDVVMQDTAIYDFYVHGCYAHDGTNTPEASISIIDQNGCAVRLARAVDVPTFFTTPVSGGAKHVYVHMYGFQFTTSQLVYFECQVRPCLQECARPQCENGNNSVRAKRSAEDVPLDHVVLRQARQAKSADADDALQNNYRLQAVLQIKPQSNDIPVGRDEPLPRTAEVRLPSGHICVHTAAALAILAIFVLVCIASLIAAFCMCRRAAKDAKSELYPSMSGRVNYYTPTSTPSQDITYAASPASINRPIGQRPVISPRSAH